MTEKVLEKPRDHDRPLAHAGQRGGRDMARAVVDEVLVNLIGEEEEVVLAAGAGRRLRVPRREDFAAGVGRRVEDDGAGARGDGGAQGVEIERPSPARPAGPGPASRAAIERGDVVAVERLEEQHFVAGIEQRHGGGVQAAGGAAGDQDFALGVVVEAVVALLLCGDGVAQAGDAVQPRVDVVAGADGLDGFGSRQAQEPACRRRPGPG